MNKSELIDAMAASAGITKAAAKLALESFFDKLINLRRNILLIRIR